MVELGGTYPDVVQALQEAKDCGALAFALRGRCPAGGRPGVRPTSPSGDDADRDGKDSAEGGTVKATPASPSPDLFYQKDQRTYATEEGDSDDDSDDAADSKEKTKPKKGFFAKMLGR